MGPEEMSKKEEEPEGSPVWGGTLRAGIAAGLVVGVLWGLTYVAWAFRVNLLGPGRDALLLTLYVIVPYALTLAAVGLAIALVVAAILALTRCAGGSDRGPGVVWGLLLGTAFFLVLHRSVNRTIYFDDFPFLHTYRQMFIFFILRTAIVLAAGVGLGILVGRLRAARRPVALPLLVLGFVVWGATMFVFQAPAPVTASAVEEWIDPPTVTKPRRVLLVGLDAADWRLMTPLMKRGDLPHLSGLVARGASAPLESPRWADSARLWASILGGKDWPRHGIHTFYYIHFRGVSRPVTFPPHGLGLTRIKRFYQGRGLANSLIANRTMRQGSLIWDILGRSGVSVGITGAITTWPVDPVPGYIISDVAGKMAERRAQGEGGRTLAEGGALFPPAIEGEVETLLASGADWRDRVAPEMMRLHPTDFTCVYFEEIDAIQHLYWHHLQPACFSPALRREAESQGFLPAAAGPDALNLDPRAEIVRAYTHADSVLGVLLEANGDTDLVIVISDHGQGPVFGDPVQKGGHFHGPAGIIILAGRGVIPGAQLLSPSIMDITPTILAYLGLPTGEDMDGRVIWEAFDPKVISRPTPATIASYELYAGPAATTAAPAPVDDALKERLRALGYIQ